jgi:hypothetical protein
MREWHSGAISNHFKSGGNSSCLAEPQPYPHTPVSALIDFPLFLKTPPNPTSASSIWRPVSCVRQLNQTKIGSSLLNIQHWTASTMVPAPRQNRPQSQPLTTTLANILRDYHAGGTVLRELLQNADDAGASQMVRRMILLTLQSSFGIDPLTSHLSALSPLHEASDSL